MQVSSAGLNHLSGFKNWLPKLENFFEAFIQCKCLFIINYKRCVLVVFTKEQKITVINLVMILHSLCILWATAPFITALSSLKPSKDRCRGLLQFPVGIISDFQIPYRSEWLQAHTWHSTRAGSCWFSASVLQCLTEALTCRVLAKGLGSLLPVFSFFKKTNYKSSLLASITTNWSLKQS